MAKKDLSSLDRTIMQPLSRDIDDAFSDGIDCDVKVMGGNSLMLYDVTDTLYNAIYTDAAGNLVIPTTTSATYNDDTALYFGTDSDVGLNWISATPYFYLSCLADGTELRIGNGTLDFDVTWYAGANTVVFNEGNADVTFNGVDLSLEDSDHLYLGDDNDIDIRWDGTDLDILPLADDEIIKFGNGTLSFDIWWYGDTADDNVIFDAGAKKVNFDGVDLQLEDDDILGFGDATAPGDVYMRWDNTDFDILAAADGTIMRFGNGTNDFDIYWYAGSDTVVFDEGAAKVTFTGVDLYLGDSDSIYLGAGSDVNIRWDGTDLDILPVLDGSDMKFGDTTHAWDITWYGEDANYSVVFSSTGNSVTFNAVDLSLEDSDHLYLGDSNDVDMYFNGANDFYILPGTDLDNIYLGSTAGDKSWDIIWTAAGAANTVTFGAAANTITLAAVDITMTTTDQINFRDTSTYIQSAAAGSISLVSTGNIYLSTPIVKRSDPTTTNSTAAVTLVATTSNNNQFFNSCGSSIVITLPTLATSAGIEYHIQNGSTGGALTVNDTGAACVAVIDYDQMGYLVCDGTTWGALVAGPST